MSQEFTNANSMPTSGNADPLGTAFANVANNLFSFPTSNSASSTLVEVINSTNQSTPTGNTNNLNITPSTTATSTAQADATTNNPSGGGNATESLVDTFIDPSGTYNVIRIDNRNFESQINFNIP